MPESYHGAQSQQWPIRAGQQLPPLPLAMRPAVCAKALGISERTLWSMTNAGTIPYAKLGKVVIHPTAQILAWLAEITVNPPVKWPEHAEGGDA